MPITKSIAQMRAEAEARQGLGSDFVGPLPPSEAVSTPLPMKAEPAPSADISTIRKLAAGASRVALPIAGSIAGGALALPSAAVSGPIGPTAGAAVGGGIGGAIGETFAQLLEGREKLSLPEIGVETAFGAIPVAWTLKAGKPAASAALGALQAGGHAAGSTFARGGTTEEALDPANIGVPAAAGAFFGGIGGRAAKNFPAKGAGRVKDIDLPTPTVVQPPAITTPAGLKARLDQIDEITGVATPLTDAERELLRPAIREELNKPHKPLTTLLEAYKKTEQKMKDVENLLGAGTKKAQAEAATDVQAMDDLLKGQAEVRGKGLKRIEQETKLEKTAEKLAQEDAKKARIAAAKAGKTYVPSDVVSESVSVVDPATGATLRTGGRFETPEGPVVGPAVPTPKTTKPLAEVPFKLTREVDTTPTEVQQALRPVIEGAPAPAPAPKEPRMPKLKGPVVSEEEMAELRRITAELDAMPFTKKVLKEAETGGGLEHVEGTGGAGANVYHDIVQEAGLSKKTRGQVLSDLKAFTEGKGRMSRSVKAALEVAKARMAGKYRTASGTKVSSPELPPSAGEPPMSVEDFAQALSQEGQKPIADVPFSLAPEASTAPTAVQQGLQVAPELPTVDPSMPWQQVRDVWSKVQGKDVPKEARQAVAKVWMPMARKMEADIAPKLKQGSDLLPEEAEFVTDLANRLHGGDVEAAGEAILSRASKGGMKEAEAEVKALGKLKGAERKAAIEKAQAFEPGYEQQVDDIAAMTPEARRSWLDELIKSESGAISPEVAARLGLHATTGLAGAALGAASAPEDEKALGAVTGGIMGAAAPFAMPKMNVRPGDILSGLGKRIPDIYRANLLTNPNNLMANVYGANVGLGLTGGLEEILSGNVKPGLELIKRVPTFPWRTTRNIPKAYDILRHEPEMNIAELAHMTEGKRGLLDKIVTAPATMIAAGDVALKEAAEESGLGEKAMEMALASEPIKTTGPRLLRVAGQRLLDMRKPITGEGRNYVGEMMFPFVRTASNIGIGAPTRTPGLGLLVNALTNPEDKLGARQLAAQQIMGTGMTAAAFELGQNMDPESAKLGRVWIRNLSGRYSPAVMAAFEAGLASKAGDPALAPAFRGFTQEGLPLESGSFIKDAYRFLQSLESEKGPRMPSGVLPAFLTQMINEARNE